MRKIILLAVFLSSFCFAENLVMPTPEQRALKEEAKKDLKELNDLIEKAKAKNIDTLRFEAVALVADLGIDKRWYLLYQDTLREEYCAWAKKNCNEAVKQLKEIMAGKKQTPIPEWPDHKKAVVKDGFYNVSGEPVIYYGMNGGERVKQFFFQKNIMEGVSAVGGSRYDYQNQPIGKAYLTYPDTHRVWGGGWCGHIIKDASSIGGQGECVICLESPNTRAAVAEYIKNTMTAKGYNKDAKGVIMGFEYYYICFCDITRGMFCEWLKTKYRTIDMLNGIWKAAYKDFVEIELPDKNFLQKAEPNDAKWFDFASFNIYRFTEYLKWAKSEMKKYGPEQSYCAGAPFYYLSGMLGSSGIDTDALNTDVNDIVLNESGPSTIDIDLLWSLADGKKVVADPEYHGDIARIYSQFLHGEGYMSMWWWPNGPVMDPPSFYASGIPYSNEIPLDDVLYSINIAFDVRRLAKTIIPFTKKILGADVALLYPKTSMLQVPQKLRNSRDTPTTLELIKSYNSALYTDTFMRILTEEQVLSDKLANRKVLMVPGAPNMPENVVKKMSEFVEKGGTLVLSPNSLLFDEYNRPKTYIKDLAGVEILGMSLPTIKVGEEKADVMSKSEGFIMGASSDMVLGDVKKTNIKMSGKSGAFASLSLEGKGVLHKAKALAGAEVIGSFADGNPAVIQNKKGKGKVIYLATPLELESMWKFIDAVEKDAGVEKPAISMGKDGARIYGIESRMLSENGSNYAYISNFSGKDQVVKLNTTMPVKKAVDLITEKVFAGMEFSIKNNRTLLLKLE